MAEEKEVLVYQGTLIMHPDIDEVDEYLTLDTFNDFGVSLPDSLSEKLERKIAGKTVTARYWITDEPITKEQAQDEIVRTVMGFSDCSYIRHYSEITGYLYTTDMIEIGGHDLLAELKHYVGDYLILEITVH